MTTKIVKVLHLAHRKKDKGLALFPFGMRYNRELTTLKKGDWIQFQSGEQFPVVSVAVVNLQSAIAELMCRYIYGKPLSRVVSQWSYNAVAEGYPRDAISTEKCLIVNYINNENEN